MLYQVINIFHLLGVLLSSLCCPELSSAEELKDIVHWVSLEGKPGPFPKASVLFLACSSLSLHPHPSLRNNCLNLPFGTWGMSGSLFPINKNCRTQEGFCAQEPHRAWLGFSPTHCLGLTFVLGVLDREGPSQKCLRRLRVTVTAMVGLPSDRHWPLCSPDQASMRPSDLVPVVEGVSHPCPCPPPPQLLS